MALTHPKITQIPQTEPYATPALWNTRYDEIDSNFGDLDGRLSASEQELSTARGDSPNLGIRLDALASSVSGHSEEADNNKIAVLQYALQQAALANSGVLALKEVAQQQGEIVIANRGLVRGCEASKSTTATRNLNFTEGACFAQGRVFSVSGTQNSASVPSNPSAAPVTVYAYLFQDANSVWRPAVTPVGTAVPQDALQLYQLTIPAGNTDATDPNLNHVTLTSVRRFESQFPRLLDSPPAQTVAIKRVDASDYQITFDLVDAQGAPCGTDAVVVSSRATNGFTVTLRSAADNVRVRWKLSRLSN